MKDLHLDTMTMQSCSVNYSLFCEGLLPFTSVQIIIVKMIPVHMDTSKRKKNLYYEFLRPDK